MDPEDFELDEDALFETDLPFPAAATGVDTGVKRKRDSLPNEGIESPQELGSEFIDSFLNTNEEVIQNFSFSFTYL